MWYHERTYFPCPSTKSLQVYKNANMQMPTLTKGQCLFILLLSLLWLYYLVSSVPSYAAQEKNPKQLSAMKTVLAYILGMIVSYLLVIVFSKLMKKGKGRGVDATPSMGGGQFGDTADSMGESDMSSPDMMPKSGKMGM